MYLDPGVDGEKNLGKEGWVILLTGFIEDSVFDHVFDTGIHGVSQDRSGAEEKANQGVEVLKH